MNTNTFIHGYHNILRPEILNKVPTSAKKILDIGCGTGRLGEAILKRQDCVVNGIEINEAAAIEARKVLNIVYNIDVNTPLRPKYGEKYDCMIFADILEHLIDPWSIFLHEVSLMKDNGTIIVSLPNIANPSIVQDLQRGLFRYAEAGILDATHMRFFTKSSFSAFLAGNDLKITDITPHPSKEDPIQWIFTIKKIPALAVQGKVTLIMPTFNTLKYTTMALDSISSHTKVPYKMIVIDNGSTDGTVQMLRANQNLVHIENDVNLGFPIAVNIALEHVDTEYFAILNSDIVVAENWLEHMCFIMEKYPKTALVGPRTNYVSGPQIVRNITYKTPEEFQYFAAARLANCKELPTELNRLVFFCVLIKSELLQTIGGLDEIFGMGNFEDDDYCRQAVTKGYKCLIDNQIFVHHFGSQTFKSSDINYQESMERNLRIYKEKWAIK